MTLEKIAPLEISLEKINEFKALIENMGENFSAEEDFYKNLDKMYNLILELEVEGIEKENITFQKIKSVYSKLTIIADLTEVNVVAIEDTKAQEILNLKSELNQIKLEKNTSEQETIDTFKEEFNTQFINTLSKIEKKSPDITLSALLKLLKSNEEKNGK